MTELTVGTKVTKPSGYPYPGTVVAAFQTLSGCPRYVVESERAPGMLHIFSGAVSYTHLDVYKRQVEALAQTGGHDA